MSWTNNDYKIISATNLIEIEKIRHVWEGMQNHPNSNIDHYLNVIVSKPHVIRPHVIILNQNDRPVSLVAGRIENLSLDLKFGYKTMCRPNARSFTIIYRGFLGDLSKDNCEVLFTEIMRLIHDDVVDMVRINYL